MFNLLIKNGQIVDGSGNPWYQGDIGIKEGKIAEIGHLGSSHAYRVIDAANLIVAPGFIDVHTHSNTTLPVNPYAESKIRQGVTTEITGNCGNSSAPIANEAVDEIREGFDILGLEINWRTLKGYLDFLENQGISLNVAALIGHGTIRKSIVGYDNRTATPQEIEAMKEMIDGAMKDGAFGMSTGLIYPPGCYTDTEELIALSKTLQKWNGSYVSHIRDEGSKVLEAGEEAIEIGRSAGISVQWSHVKAAGSKVWGKSSEILSLMEEAQKNGVDVTGDLYPYEATSTGLSMFLPKWAHEGGRGKLLERLHDQDLRDRLAEEITARRRTRGNWDKIIIASVSQERNRVFEGLTIEAIAEKMNKKPVDVVIHLLGDDDGEVSMVSFAMSEDDICNFMKHPLIMIGSDGNSLSPHGTLGNGKPHPRHYGTFPRVLGRYVRQKNIISIETAVKKMTSLPASSFGICDRGLLAPGMYADITIFDPNTVIDKATYTNPHQYPAGIEYVIVNGEVTIDQGDHTLALSGRVLRKNK